jgi:hypothetical protein
VSVDWFEGLFGFREGRWAETRSRFSLADTHLRAPNGRTFGVGRFSTPRLSELRERAAAVARPGRLTLRHEAIGDVLELHALPENAGAMFQVASQLNCLEFVGPSVVPEDGVTGYAHDNTQGPACSLAAAPATVYRNYFAEVNGESGQTRERQLNTLADLAATLGEPDAYFTVRNGYTHSDRARLEALDSALVAHPRDSLLAQVRIGVQTGVEVTFARRYSPPGEPAFVSQAFCSALSCGYVHGVPTDAWAPLATLVLDAAYEATLLAAACDAAEGDGSGVVWLTFLGGGVFGNRPEWIRGAIARAVERASALELDVRIGHYRRIDETMRRGL